MRTWRNVIDLAELEIPVVGKLKRNQSESAKINLFLFFCLLFAHFILRTQNWSQTHGASVKDQGGDTLN